MQAVLPPGLTLLCSLGRTPFLAHRLDERSGSCLSLWSPCSSLSVCVLPWGHIFFRPPGLTLFHVSLSAWSALHPALAAGLAKSTD